MVDVTDECVAKAEQYKAEANQAFKGVFVCVCCGDHRASSWTALLSALLPVQKVALDVLNANDAISACMMSCKTECAAAAAAALLLLLCCCCCFCPLHPPHNTHHNHNT
jgi:hypothetical protein